MFKWVAPKLPPRAPTSDYTSLLLDNGLSRVVFNTHLLAQVKVRAQQNQPRDVSTTKFPLASYLVYNRIPPAPNSTNDVSSSLNPPFHIHLREHETFHVLCGTARFLLMSSTEPKHCSEEAHSTDGLIERYARSGDTITIPSGQIHTFRNASQTEPLEVEFGFMPSMPNQKSVPRNTAKQPKGTNTDLLATQAQINAKLHRFFLNTQLYRSDCSTRKIPRSLLQILLFNYHADIALVPTWLLTIHKRFPQLRRFIEARVAPTLGRVMNYVGGQLIGKRVFGLRETYPEYYPYDSLSVVSATGTSGPELAQPDNTKPYDEHGKN